MKLPKKVNYTFECDICKKIKPVSKLKEEWICRDCFDNSVRKEFNEVNK